MYVNRLYSSIAIAALLICPSGAESADYLRDVKPVLKARCFACHGALKQESGLRLDTAGLIRRGGDGGAIVKGGEATSSELIARISATDDSVRMPPEGHPLTPEQITAVAAWINSGAAGPENESPEEDPRDHWAFQPPVRANVPAIEGVWGNNPIDALIADAHRKRNLRPVDSVEKSLLLRRVYLDLIGLPPTREQLHAFLADDSPDTWGRVVDVLLESDQYGERWGRHWMDVWRYTDWYGLGAQLRNSQKHIWHWRDWIVESLNEDKGYDRMIVEMLAGDEIAPTDPNTLRATGFLARNYYLFNRTTWLDDTIEHTSKAFLGLTMNCNKCHDHKYDPLSQLDYYNMRAFFEPHQIRLDSVPGQTDLEKDGLPRAFDAHPDVPTYLHIRGNEKDLDKENPITAAVPAVLQFDEFAITSVSLPIQAHRPELREFVLNDALANANSTINTARNKLASLRKQLAASPREGRAESTGKGQRGDIFITDAFDKPNPDVWQTGPGSWRYESGKLIQSESGDTRKYIRTKQQHPPDFQATMKFRTTGGEMWKSVGISFDCAATRRKTVYMSAYSGGSKVQISFDDGNGWQYPLPGKKDLPVILNESYELKVSLRDKLINVAIDGKHQLAFALPVNREAGSIELFAFDAAVEFDSIEVRTLPASVMLIAADDKAKAMSPAELREASKVAEAELAAAELKPALLRAAFAADLARYQNPPAGDASALIAAAAKLARQHEAATARTAVATAEQKLAAADTKTQQKVEQELSAARTTLEAADKAIASPGETYPSQRASRKALEGPAETEASRYSAYPTASTGRRTALAAWMTDRRHPLTARVAVNHIWLRHFGQPLVDDVTDFGRRAKTPPMQNLLDHLAVELMENNWSMKHLHRLIVTSQAYRLSTSTRDADAATQQSDPNNSHYWRRQPVRMESEVLRDSLLQLAGRLDPAIGGPTIDPNNTAAHRRSLYFTRDRDHQNKFLGMFDDPDILRCYRRSESVVPQQALTLANSKLSLEMAREVVKRWEEGEKGSGGDKTEAEFVQEMFETVLCRSAEEDEVKLCVETIARLLQELGDREDAEFRARSALVHALFNHNDFVTVR